MSNDDSTLNAKVLEGLLTLSNIGIGISELLDNPVLLGFSGSTQAGEAIVKTRADSRQIGG